MLNRSASLAMSTYVLKALPGKLDIKRHSPSILYLTYHIRHQTRYRCLDSFSATIAVVAAASAAAAAASAAAAAAAAAEYG